MTRNERETLDKLIEEFAKANFEYISYISPSGFGPGGSDRKVLIRLFVARNKTRQNIKNYLDAVTEKRDD